jgi:flagellar assembly protein FliH
VSENEEVKILTFTYENTDEDLYSVCGRDGLLCAEKIGGADSQSVIGNNELLDDMVQEGEKTVRDLLEQARREADSLIEKAREEAEKLLEEARNECGRIGDEARTDGYDQGLKNAQKEIEEDRQFAMEQCNEMLAEAQRNKQKIIESSMADMTRLSILIAKKILATEIKTNPAVIVNVIREAVSYLDSPEVLKVFLSPEDIEGVHAQIADADLNDTKFYSPTVELHRNKNITSGGCIVESDVGSIDAQLETRIDNVEKAIWEAAIDGYNQNV